MAAFEKFWEEREGEREISPEALVQGAIIRAVLYRYSGHNHEEAANIVVAFDKKVRDVGAFHEMNKEELNARPVSELVALLGDAYERTGTFENIWYSPSNAVARKISESTGKEIWPKSLRETLRDEPAGPIFDALRETFPFEAYRAIARTIQEMRNQLKKRSSSKPDEISDYVRLLHDTGEIIDQQVFDDILGLNLFNPEKDTDYKELQARYPGETFWEHEGRWSQYTRLEDLRGVIKDLNLSEADTLYDLGSGYGHVPLYAALTTPAVCKGLEIVPNRAKEADKARKRLRIPNVEFRQGNVLDADFSDGTVFFLFNPFSTDTLREVGERLRKIAEKKTIRIASYSSSEGYFRSQYWLRPIKGEGSITIFESVL